ncbi:MAG: CHASE2 domain-containing protein [Oligoflexia bacterium]|nr:CHASE2 domain-containing protein [Oligoflexia bacterium]
MILRKLLAWKRLISSRVRDSIGLVMRSIVCLAFGWIALITTNQTSYDSRFLLRGPQKIDDDVLIVYLSREDAVRFSDLDPGRSVLWSLKEIVETSDSFFWEPESWDRAIGKVMNAGAKASVVTLYFSDDTVRQPIQQGRFPYLKKNGVFWAAQSDFIGGTVLPGLAMSDGRNTGTLELRPDMDGKIRYFTPLSLSTTHMSVRVDQYLRKRSTEARAHFGSFINFQGPQTIFRSVSFTQILRNEIPNEMIRGKIVVFGLQDNPGHTYQTPVGQMTSAALTATLIYNLQHERWIRQVPLWLSFLFMIGLFIFALRTIFRYPPTVTLVFLSFLALGIVALSSALFDLYAIWLPLTAPLLFLAATYVVISGYRLSESEKESWFASQELRTFSELESLKTNFLSLISHDLKTPLAKIQGITDRLLAQKELPDLESFRKDLKSIQLTSDELRAYIGSILKLTRIEARELQISKESHDLNRVIEDVVSRLNPLAVEKQVTLTHELEPLFSLEFDKTLISEVVLNLVENAIKYSDTGGHVTVRSRESGDFVEVEIADTGAGIAKEELDKVFDKFYRGNSLKTQAVSGTGLGLYLAKYFIELHGGKVFINSEIGKGTVIGFRLPIAEPTPEEEYAEPARTHR